MLVLFISKFGGISAKNTVAMSGTKSSTSYLKLS